VSGAPHAQRLSLAFGHDGRELFVHEGVRRGTIRRLTDQDAVDLRRGLQALARVDHVAGDRTADLLADRRDERLAGVDADSYVQVQVRSTVVQVRDGVQDPQSRTDCPLRIVLVRDRHPEETENTVADEVVDGPAVMLDAMLHLRVVRPQRRLHVLRIHALGFLGERDEVTEQDRDDLPLFRGRLQRDGGAATHAEVGFGRVLGAAARAHAHGTSLGVVRSVSRTASNADVA
jgi:hypothetical protein